MSHNRDEMVKAVEDLRFRNLKQMQVKDFVHKYVLPSLQRQFYALMRQWDGWSDVSGAFYNMDLLNMKLKEAQG